MSSRLSVFLSRSYSRDGAILLLRLWLGAMLIYHGQGKIFGNMERFIHGVSNMGFPAPEVYGWAAALTEFVGGILIASGFFTRPAASFAICTMFVAGFIRHSADPFGRKELAFTYLVMAAVVLIAGPGKFSIDRKMFGKMER